MLAIHIIIVYHTHMNMTVRRILGDALYEDGYGGLCEELVAAGYNLDDYYSAANAWGNFDRVLVIISYIRGARSYDEYLGIFEAIKQGHDRPVSKQLYARLTGIKAKNLTQTERTRRYRQNINEELLLLREDTAKRWIKDNLALAKEYIATLSDKTVVK